MNISLCIKATSKRSQKGKADDDNDDDNDDEDDKNSNEDDDDDKDDDDEGHLGSQNKEDKDKTPTKKRSKAKEAASEKHQKTLQFDLGLSSNTQQGRLYISIINDIYHYDNDDNSPYHHDKR